MSNGAANESSCQPGASPAVALAETTRLRAGCAPMVGEDKLAREEPLEIRIRGSSVAVTMRTPGYDVELAAGFILSEGLVSAPKEIVGIAHCAQEPANNEQPTTNNEQQSNIVNVFLAPEVPFDLERLTRHVFASSSCGLCGKASIEAVQQHFPPVTSDLQIASAILAGLPDKMRKAQATFAETGGLHAAALFDRAGELIILREDVGRHNAVDKVLGRGFLSNSFPFDSHILLVSGRASFEIMQKALAGRVPIVCAVSAPSSLAVDFARQNNQTLVGFLRHGGMNIYSCPERVLAGEV